MSFCCTSLLALFVFGGRGYAGHVACRVAVVMPGRIVVVMPGCIVVDMPDMLSIEFAGSYMHNRHEGVKYLSSCSSLPLHRHRPLFVIAISLSSTIIHPSQLTNNLSSLIHHISSIVAIIVIDCHCHLSLSSSVLHLHRQSWSSSSASSRSLYHPSLFRPQDLCCLHYARRGHGVSCDGAHNRRHGLQPPRSTSL